MRSSKHMRFLMGIIGIGFGFILIYYREAIGNSFGQPEWASKVGGIYNVMIILGIFFFFASLVYMTGTFEVLFPASRGLPNL